MLPCEGADAQRQKVPRRRKAPGPARPAAPSRAEALERRLLDRMCGADEAVRWAAADRVRRSVLLPVGRLVLGLAERLLAGPGPSPLERLLVERVVACWLQVHYSDASYAQLKGTNPAQHTAALQRQNSAQQRYLQALKALATVRKLLRPGLSPVDLAMRPVPERPAGRLAGASAPADGEPVLN